MWNVLVLGAVDAAGSLAAAGAGVVVAAGATEAKERIAVADLKAERDAAMRRAEERREAIGNRVRKRSCRERESTRVSDWIYR